MYRPRKRMVSPSIWGSVDFGTILVRTEEAAAGMFFIGLISLSDDHGVIRWSPERLGQEILRGLYLTHKGEISGWLDEFCNLQMIDRFSYESDVEEREYLMLTSWFDYQKVPHPKLSEQPLPPYELLEKYPGYRDGLLSSIQKFLHENPKSGIKCPNFNRKYAEYLNIDSNIPPQMFESSTQIKEKETESKSKSKRAMSESENESSETSVWQKNFDEFWEYYPRKDKKIEARKAFKALNPDEELMSVIIKDIGVKKNSKRWKKEKGDFIPLPTNYIEGERWADEGTKISRRGETWTN